jgi:hypothetical protein
MVNFRCYFLDGTRRVAFIKDIECPSETGAIQQAQRALFNHSGVERWEGFEIWHGSLRVYAEQRSC